MRRTCALAIVFALAGCDGARGTMITGDGRILPATAENFRAEVERTVVASVRGAVPPEATVEARIDELPRFGDSRRDPMEGWYFQAIHAHVVVRGAQPSDRDAVVAAAAKALRGRTQFHDSTHIEAEIAPAVAAAPTAAAAPAPPVAPTAATGASTPATAPTARRYVAHAGDTLADLSTAFYGSPERWRTIRDANPQVDFTALKGGEELTIPPAPR